MIKLSVKNETSTLKSVVLGTAKNFGGTPTLESAYDPKSREHILNGTFPLEQDLIVEMEAFESVLSKYHVKVLRPDIIKDYNQIFARDIGFVVDDFFIKSNILPDREREIDAVKYILDQIPANRVIQLPENAHVEGGDVMPWNNHVFVGTYDGEDYPDCITARTNIHAVKALEQLFPDKIVKSFNLLKSNTNARENALHLDCCFQPIGVNQAILYRGGFQDQEDVTFLIDYFGEENIIEIDQEEMYNMNSNVFSISPTVIVSEKGFTRLNRELRKRGFIVEEIPYSETAKMEGLLRCSTLPLLRV